MQGTVYIKLGNDRVPLELGSRFCVVYSTTDPMNSTEEGSFLATKCDKKYHAICKGKKRGTLTKLNNIFISKAMPFYRYG